MIISKRPNGTIKLNGISFEILDYTAKALNIRKVLIKYQERAKPNNVITNIKTCNIDFAYFFYSYEFVFVKLEDLQKYGFRTAQVNAIKNDV